MEACPMRVIRYNLGPLDNNTYLVVDESSGDTAIVDPTFGSRSVWADVERNGYRLRYVLNTHAHIDHVVENAYFARVSGAPLALHPDDLPLLRAMDTQAMWLGMDPPEPRDPDIWLKARGRIGLGDGELTVVHTPGHSPGHVSLLGPGFALVGDVLFQGSIGRTDLPGGNLEELLSSIQRELLPLSDDTVVYTGHGPITTIGDEKRTNPFLQNLR
jgi:hydroxyacylglutathione hydrolase